MLKEETCFLLTGETTAGSGVGISRGDNVEEENCFTTVETWLAAGVGEETDGGGGGEGDSEGGTHNVVGVGAKVEAGVDTELDAILAVVGMGGTGETGNLEDDEGVGPGRPDTLVSCEAECAISAVACASPPSPAAGKHGPGFAEGVVKVLANDGINSVEKLLRR